MTHDLELYSDEFDRCAAWIESAIPYSNHCWTIQDVKAACMAGKMQLWPGEKSALVTEICQYPVRTGCLVAFAGGDLDELRSMAPTIKQWAKSKGCDFVSVMGRKGWVRALGIGRICSTFAVEDI